MDAKKKRSLRSRAAAYQMHAQGKTNTAPARAAFLAKFEREVDPDGVLDPKERKRRADLALRAHMLRLRAARGK